MRGRSNSYRCFPLDFIERCNRHPRCADTQPEERLLRDSPRQADCGERRVGVGKVSLAFDTIYAEGQRRYVESLSAYARQFLERIEKPDVDVIEGLAPAIAIKQKNTTRNPRSTVATATEIYDYLRLLYARCGTVHCIYCDGLVKRDSIDEVAEAVLALGEGTRLHVLFPVKHEPPEKEPEKADEGRKREGGEGQRKDVAQAAADSPMTDA